jgi:hypothetical protein
MSRSPKDLEQFVDSSLGAPIALEAMVQGMLSLKDFGISAGQTLGQAAPGLARDLARITGLNVEQPLRETDLRRTFTFPDSVVRGSKEAMAHLEARYKGRDDKDPAIGATTSLASMKQFELRSWSSSPQYLMTLDELYAAAVANLGPMDQSTYAQASADARRVGSEMGIKNPTLIIDIQFTPGSASQFGVTEQPYPIADMEWDQFKSDARTMAAFMPNVYVVDGDKFTAPI